VSADITPATEALLKELYTDAKPKTRRGWQGFTFIHCSMLSFSSDKITSPHRPVIPQMSSETVRLLDELYGHGYVADAEFERIQASVMEDYAEVFEQLADA